MGFYTLLIIFSLIMFCLVTATAYYATGILYNSIMLGLFAGIAVAILHSVIRLLSRCG